MKQTERIQYMEQLLDFVIKARKEQTIHPKKSARIQEAIGILAEYYGSDEWKQDFADDEAGLLPKDLKRGVLSEDGIWNVLSSEEHEQETNHSLSLPIIFFKKSVFACLSEIMCYLCLHEHRSKALANIYRMKPRVSWKQIKTIAVRVNYTRMRLSFFIV